MAVWIGSAFSLHTFPFEGNWNFSALTLTSPVARCLATHFPVWREWKHGPAGHGQPVRILATHFPVWREWKLHALSKTLDKYIRDSSLHTFPFEGNGNRCFFSAFVGFNLFLATHFPVWRELKLPLSLDSSRCQTRYTLSRLKGIETTFILYWYDLNTFTRYTLSRLKGIETNHHRVWPCIFQNVYSLHTFPFEGNWNIKKKALPLHRILATHFPVWRELKHRASDNMIPIFTNSLHTFPFEGNWNDTLPMLLPPVATRYTLSRLKGMETQS